ncbi:MAG: hypothetical protein ACKO0Z_16235 [Betaproteobacteria bacterium]
MSKKTTTAKTFKQAKTAGKAAIVSTQAMSYANGIVQQLNALCARREQWEATDFKKANDGLYTLLSECHGVFEQQFLHANAEQRKALRESLVQSLTAAGIRVVKTSHTLTMLVRYVFQSDRNRAHGYANVLIAAITHGISSSELVSWIGEQGGIEEIKRKSKPKTVEQLAKQARVEDAKAQVQSAIQTAAHKPLATIDVPGLTGNYAILLAKPNIEGSADIVGTLSDVSDALYQVLIKQMSAQHIKKTAELELLDKEVADLLAGPKQDTQEKVKAA